MSEPHVPLRTCVGCRRRFAKQSLVRFVVSERGLDLGDAGGRGTYLCRNRSCLEAALRRKDFRGIAARTECAQALARLRGVVDCGDGRVACEVNGGSVIG